MTEEESLRLEGELIGIVAMLQQLYVVTSNAHGGGSETLTAWRADLEAGIVETTTAMASGKDPDIEAMGASALAIVENVFAPII